jgi:hypothetical protein
LYDLTQNRVAPLDPSKLIPALMRYETIAALDERSTGSNTGAATSPTSATATAAAGGRKADKLLGIEGKEDKRPVERVADATASSSAGDEDESNHAIRFLKFCVKKARNKDPAIHNYLISLLVKQPGESKLLQFIDDQKARPLYDYKYALRLCHQVYIVCFIIHLSLISLIIDNLCDA